MTASTRLVVAGVVALLLPWRALAAPAAPDPAAPAPDPSTVPPPLPDPMPPPLPSALPPPLPPFATPVAAPIPGVLGAHRVAMAGVYTMLGGVSLMVTGGLLSTLDHSCDQGCIDPSGGTLAGLGLAFLGLNGIGVGVCLGVAGGVAEDAALKRAGAPRVAVVPTGRGVAVAGRF